MTLIEAVVEFASALGGLFVGGGAVIVYAKATGQTLAWKAPTTRRRTNCKRIPASIR